MSEFKMLMALWTAFGRDSLLRQVCSIQDLCYDWLQFKYQEPSQSLKSFVKLLLNWELAQNPGPEGRTILRGRVNAFLDECQETPRTSPPSNPMKTAPRLPRLAVPPHVEPTADAEE
jgi:hypothetical protein